LDGGEDGRRGGDGVLSTQFALEEAALKEKRAIVETDSGDIADEGPAAADCEGGGEVAHLIGVREQDDLGACFADKRREGGDGSVGGVKSERIVLEPDYGLGGESCDLSGGR